MIQDLGTAILVLGLVKIQVNIKHRIKLIHENQQVERVEVLEAVEPFKVLWNDPSPGKELE
jgi:hypothetical protein